MRLASLVADDCSIKIWDFAKKEVMQAIDHEHQAAISCLAFSYDGDSYLTADDNKHMMLWSMTTNTPTAKSNVHAILETTGFCDGEKIVGLTRDRTVMTYELSDDPGDIDHAEVMATIEKPAKRKSVVGLPGAPPGSPGVPPYPPPVPPNTERTRTRKTATSTDMQPASPIGMLSRLGNAGSRLSSSFRSRGSSNASDSGSAAPIVIDGMGSPNIPPTAVSGPPLPDMDLRKRQLEGELEEAFEEINELRKILGEDKRTILVKDAEIASDKIKMTALVSKNHEKLTQLNSQWKTYMEEQTAFCQGEFGRLNGKIQTHMTDNATLLKEYDISKRDAAEERNKFRNVISGKDGEISELKSDVARLEEELRVEKSRNRQMGYVSSLVTDILKGTECIDMRHSPAEATKKVEELQDMIKTAILTRSQPLPQGKNSGEVANLTVKKEVRV